MIRIPTNITILGKQYPIKVIDDAGKDISGWIDEGTIYLNTAAINKNDIDNDALYTLFHEIGHSIFRRSGLMQAISSELEEVVVDLFAKCFVENFVIKFRKSPIVLND